jgi:hypothetical protein
MQQVLKSPSLVNYKQTKCYYYERDNFCKYGSGCQFAHSEKDIRSAHDITMLNSIATAINCQLNGEYFNDLGGGQYQGYDQNYLQQYNNQGYDYSGYGYQKQDPNSYQQYDPNLYQQHYDPNLYQQQYDPNMYQQYDPNMYQQYDPNMYQQYDPNMYQQYDPNYNYSGTTDTNYGTYQPEKSTLVKEDVTNTTTNEEKSKVVPVKIDNNINN